MVVEGILTIILSLIVYAAIPMQIKSIEKNYGGDIFLHAGRLYLSCMIFILFLRGVYLIIEGL